jgi:hypothetical protein
MDNCQDNGCVAVVETRKAVIGRGVFLTDVDSCRGIYFRKGFLSA